uniref:hypothetical protein n=1 Tax=Amycolatopsis sp. CA-096443 TaxID=3239919 RepID=UPI003F494328
MVCQPLARIKIRTADDDMLPSQLEQAQGRHLSTSERPDLAFRHFTGDLDCGSDLTAGLPGDNQHRLQLRAHAHRFAIGARKRPCLPPEIAGPTTSLA